MFTIFQDLRAIDENGFHSGGVLVGLGEGRVIGNSRWIEHNYIGKHSFLEKATMIEAEICCWQPAQPVHGFG
jgi:hypothetical protein